MSEDGSPVPARALRRDAAQNAERLLAAAIRTGLNEGRQIPMAEIAAAAGVGVGTLYRRYPNREALLEALQVRAYQILIGVADRALVSGAPGVDGIEMFLAGSFEHREELVLPLHGAPWSSEGESARLRATLRESLTAIVERGYDDGTVRDDVNARTIVQYGAMVAQPMTRSPGWSRTVLEQRRVFLRGISPDRS